MFTENTHLQLVFSIQNLARLVTSFLWFQNSIDQAVSKNNRGEKPAIDQFFRGSLPSLTNDMDTKREKMMSVCFGFPWSEKCKQNHACSWFEQN